MVAKARLVEIQWDDNQQQFNAVPNGTVVPVQFNPESLKVSFANENRGGNQPSGGGGQFVGNGTSKMTVDLLFDTTESGTDVRLITEQVAKFVQAKDPRQSGNSRNSSSNRVPPGISFEWGTFIFRGVTESMDETLDYFSEDGVPMRATVALNISRQQIKFEFGQRGQAAGSAAAAQPAGGQTPGSQPMEPSRPGDSVQQMAARQGNSGNWKAIAAANGIDNPLRLSAGALVNMQAGASAGVGFAAGASAGFSAGASAGASAAAGAGFGVGAAAGISGGGAVGFSAGLGGGVGFSAGVGASAGAGIGASAGASAGFGAGASVGGGFGASAGASASLGAGASAGASFGANAGTGATGGGFLSIED